MQLPLALGAVRLSRPASYPNGSRDGHSPLVRTARDRSTLRQPLSYSGTNRELALDLERPALSCVADCLAIHRAATRGRRWHSISSSQAPMASQGTQFARSRHELRTHLIDRCASSSSLAPMERRRQRCRWHLRTTTCRRPMRPIAPWNAACASTRPECASDRLRRISTPLRTRLPSSRC